MPDRHRLISSSKLTKVDSVCFASLYRIITITRLVQSMDISWAKSDVFIWSSVEPSIGIISGCLPTLRPLLMYIINASPIDVSSFRKSSQQSESQQSHTLDTLETISKKRMRRINVNDDLESTFVGDEESETRVQSNGMSWVRTKRGQDQTGRWRPDEDEMCLTTTTVQGSEQDGNRSGEEGSEDRIEDGGIVMTKEFDWDETRRSLGAGK